MKSQCVILSNEENGNIFFYKTLQGDLFRKFRDLIMGMTKQDLSEQNPGAHRCVLEIKSKESINSRKKDKNEENITTPRMWSDVVRSNRREDNRKPCDVVRRDSK